MPDFEQTIMNWGDPIVYFPLSFCSLGEQLTPVVVLSEYFVYLVCYPDSLKQDLPLTTTFAKMIVHDYLIALEPA